MGALTLPGRLVDGLDRLEWEGHAHWRHPPTRCVILAVPDQLRHGRPLPLNAGHADGPCRAWADYTRSSPWLAGKLGYGLQRSLQADGVDQGGAQSDTSRPRPLNARLRGSSISIRQASQFQRGPE